MNLAELIQHLEYEARTTLDDATSNLYARIAHKLGCGDRLSRREYDELQNFYG
jgi:hypothetical protein